MENLTDTEKKIINQLQNRKSDRIVKMTCVDCGAEFETTVGRISSSYHAGYIVPCRCAECKSAKDEKFKAYTEQDSDK